MNQIIAKLKHYLNGCVIGKNVTIWKYTNLYGCNIGKDTSIGSYTEIGGPNTSVGENCTIGARVYIPPGIIIGDNVFIGPGVVFTNDKYPKSHNDEFELKTTVVGDNTSIGAGCVILPGVMIGENVLIGAGTTVSKDVPSNSIVYERKQYERKNKTF